MHHKTLAGPLISLFVPAFACAATIQFQAVIGGSGQLSVPTGIAADAAGNLYVASAGGNSLVIYDSNHRFLRQIGSSGAGDGQFNWDSQVALGPTGKVYALDSGNHRVQRFSSLADGAGFELAFPAGTSAGGLYGLAIDTTGGVFVADTPNHRIQKFDAAGTPLTTFGSLGAGDGQLDHPTGLAIDCTGRLLVADSFNQRIAIWSADGTYLSSFSTGPTTDDRPKYVAVDASNDVFVTFDNNTLSEFDMAGNRLTTFGSSGSLPGQFSGLQALTVDAAGNLYTTESSNNRVQQFAVPEPAASATMALAAATFLARRRLRRKD